MKIYDRKLFWKSIFLYGLAILVSGIGIIYKRDMISTYLLILIWAINLTCRLVISLSEKRANAYRKKVEREEQALSNRFGDYALLVRLGWLIPLGLSLLFVTISPGISVFLLFLGLPYAFWLDRVISKNLPPEE